MEGTISSIFKYANLQPESKQHIEDPMQKTAVNKIKTWAFNQTILEQIKFEVWSDD